MIVVHDEMPGTAPPAGDCAVAQGFRVIDRQFRVHHQHGAESVAVRTGAERTVEREIARFHTAETDAAVDTCQPFADAFVFPGTGIVVRGLFENDDQFPAAAFERGFHGIVQPRPFQRSGDQTVHDRFYVVPERLGKRLHLVGQFHDMTVYPGADKTVAPDFVDHVAQFAFPSGDVRREDHHLFPGGDREDFFADCFRGLSGELFAAFRAVRDSGVRVKQAQVIVNLRHGGDG